LEILRTEKPELARRYGLKRLAPFGSYARADQREDSEVDIWWKSNRRSDSASSSSRTELRTHLAFALRSCRAAQIVSCHLVCHLHHDIAPTVFNRQVALSWSSYGDNFLLNFTSVVLLGRDSLFEILPRIGSDWSSNQQTVESLLLQKIRMTLKSTADHNIRPQMRRAKRQE
jgi:predicted nucleotidyltransferase